MQQPRLLDRVRFAIRALHDSRHTEKAYTMEGAPRLVANLLYSEVTC